MGVGGAVSPAGAEVGEDAGMMQQMVRDFQRKAHLQAETDAAAVTIQRRYRGTRARRVGRRSRRGRGRCVVCGEEPPSIEQATCPQCLSNVCAPLLRPGGPGGAERVAAEQGAVYFTNGGWVCV